MNVGYLKITAALLVLACVPALAGQSVDESWDLDANATVIVENLAGSIDIVGWDRNEAHLTGELGDSVDELEISASKSMLKINVANRNSRNIDGTRLKLMVPEGANVDASAVSADIDVSDLNNDKLSASSVSGNVEVDITSKRVTIESVSGDVSFSGSTGRISAESVSGDIDLRGISGEIAATTVSGDMELQAKQVESAKLETVSGDLVFAGELSTNARLTAESMSGDVEVNLPSDQSGLFKAESFSGRISTDFGSVDHAKHGPGSYLKHMNSRGGAEIRVESFSGNIKLKSR
jgi:DUF4097 and DUF4098 domain-containing protein YvlB